MLGKIVLRDAKRWVLFADPLDVLVADDVSTVMPTLVRAERHVREDQVYAAGFVSYEAAAGFDEALVTQPAGMLPLVCLGLYRAPQPFYPRPPAGAVPASGVWSMTESRDEYFGKIAAIKNEIARGNSYQVNYTLRQRSEALADAWDLFLNIAVDAPYAAWVECDGHAIVSASPELFFELNGEHLRCKPMKGTAARGMTLADDRKRCETLRSSAKDRAENVMIADMVRNDVGRIAIPGSVRAEALFEVEKYRTVWQMTSTVTARTGAPVAGIFRALFPCASVTGAPKVSSMKIISELEGSPREIYTGTIGYLAPERKARFNVAIRTALIDRASGKAVYGVGGGIVWDSQPEAEYQECLDKARVLSSGALSDFDLLETLLWTPDGGYFLLDEHLRRLADSAEYFDFAFDRAAVETLLDRLTRRLPAESSRIRLLLHRNGAAALEEGPLAAAGLPDVFRLKLAPQPIDTGDPFLYHKTTNRAVYRRARAAVEPCDDVLLWNAANEITESTIANVVVRLHGELITPPVECGLLGGTYRLSLLREGRIAERRIGIDDLRDADEVFLINSVRGWIRCSLSLEPTPPLLLQARAK